MGIGRNGYGFVCRFSLDLICKYIRASIFPSTVMILDILDMVCLIG
jgi:hypothetical protein